MNERIREDNFTGNWMIVYVQMFIAVICEGKTVIFDFIKLFSPKILEGNESKIPSNISRARSKYWVFALGFVLAVKRRN